MSPLQMTVVRVEADEEHSADKEYPCAGMLFTVCTDQSGPIGLLRHLRGLGFVFLSVRRVDTDVTKNERV